MKRRNGFTLIELLAVIVILAIIALIATPTILGVIEKTKENSARNSALGYLDAINYYIINSKIEDNLRDLKVNVKYNVTVGTIIEEEYYEPLNEYISIKGEKPTGSEDYAIIDKNGLVIEGKLTIKGYEMIIENGKIIDIQKGKIIKLEEINVVDESVTMELNSTYQIKLEMVPNNATNQRVTYNSNNDNVIVDEYGNVTSKKVGNSIITIESKSDSTIKTTVNIEIINSATGLELSLDKNEIYVGETTKITSILIPSDTTTSKGITYTTDVEGIVEIKSTGEIIGLKKGIVEITGSTVNGITDKVTLQVNPVLATSIELTTDKNSIKIGENLNLNYEVLPSNTTNKEIIWTVDNPNIAFIENGTITGISNGTVTITASTTNGITSSLSIDIYKSYEITNRIQNSGFEDNSSEGIGKWNIPSSGDVGIVSEKKYSGIYSFKNTFSTTCSGCGLNQLQTLTSGHIYYAMEYVYLITNPVNSSQFDLYRYGGTITGYPEYGNISLINLETNKWNRLSFIFTSSVDYDYWFRTAYSINDTFTIYFDNILFVDLTDTFGTGNEPSLEWCDNNIDWFDGTSTIYYK